MTSVLQPIAIPGLALVLCVAVPVALMRMLVPSLERGRGVANYRGAAVFAGLGVVWVIWAGCAIACGVVAATLDGRSALVVLTLLGPLALVASALGLVDDAYGSAEDRGFRGHFRALARGRITTGMLKLIGIGVASVVVAAVLAPIAPWGLCLTGVARIGGIALAAMAIALTTNFVNLMDLRPGRALKMYSVLVVAGVPVVTATIFGGPVGAPSEVTLSAVSGIALAAALLGPVFAVWRFDLTERGMLGDAGANAMGAVAGALLIIAMPLWVLGVYSAALLGLNVLSEKVSFSAVIERTAALRWLDRLGRLPEGEPPPASAESLAAPPSDVGGSRYHHEDDHNTEEA